MAGNGPPPKSRDARRRKNEPARGDWLELAPLDEPVLPVLPKRAKGEGQWPAATRAAWNAWRSDPVTGQYGEADVSYALDTIRLHAVMTPQTAGEVRLRMDALGLTPKGRRDNRWRYAEPAEVVDHPASEKPERQLRAV